MITKPALCAYLAELEKRRVLADLMARKADNIVGKEGLYKLTYKEGGEE